MTCLAQGYAVANGSPGSDLCFQPSESLKLLCCLCEAGSHIPVWRRVSLHVGSSWLWGLSKYVTSILVFYSIFSQVFKNSLAHLKYKKKMCHRGREIGFDVNLCSYPVLLKDSSTIPPWCFKLEKKKLDTIRRTKIW